MNGNSIDDVLLHYVFNKPLITLVKKRWKSDFFLMDTSSLNIIIIIRLLVSSGTFTIVQQYRDVTTDWSVKLRHWVTLIFETGNGIVTTLVILGLNS